MTAMIVSQTPVDLAKNPRRARRKRLEPLTGVLLEFADALDRGDLVAAERLCAQAEQMAHACWDRKGGAP